MELENELLLLNINTGTNYNNGLVEVLEEVTVS